MAASLKRNPKRRRPSQLHTESHDMTGPSLSGNPASNASIEPARAKRRARRSIKKEPGAASWSAARHGTGFACRGSASTGRKWRSAQVRLSSRATPAISSSLFSSAWAMAPNRLSDGPNMASGRPTVPGRPETQRGKWAEVIIFGNCGQVRAADDQSHDVTAARRVESSRPLMSLRSADPCGHKENACRPPLGPRPSREGSGLRPSRNYRGPPQGPSDRADRPHLRAQFEQLARSESRL